MILLAVRVGWLSRMTRLPPRGGERTCTSDPDCRVPVYGALAPTASHRYVGPVFVALFDAARLVASRRLNCFEIYATDLVAGDIKVAIVSRKIMKGTYSNHIWFAISRMFLSLGNSTKFALKCTENPQVILNKTYIQINIHLFKNICI